MNAGIFGLALLLVSPVLAANIKPRSSVVAIEETAPVPSVTSVQVLNFPNPQNMAGTVNIGNLPLDANGNLRVSVPGPRTFRFVGVTTHAVTGGSFPYLSGVCASEFPGSRVAFSEELRATLPPQAVPATAWIVFRPTILYPSIDTAYDGMGNWLPLNGNLVMSCGVWASGVVVVPDDSFRHTPCSEAHAVACAAPE